MKQWIRALPVLALFACGDAVVPEAGFRPEDLLIRTSEWFWLAPDVIPEVRVRVVDPAGEPVAGAEVLQVVMPRFLVTMPRLTPIAATDGAGRCIVADLPINCWVMARKEGFASRMVAPVVIGLRRGEELEIALQVPGRVHGIARAGDDRPVAGAEVMAVNGDNDWFAVARTDAAGRFDFDAAPPGRIMVFMVPGAHTGRGPELDLPPMGSREILIEAIPTPEMTGVVVAEANGRPVAGAVVRTLVQEEGDFMERYVRTGPDGRFTLPDAHTGALFVHADGYAEGRLILSPTDPRGSLEIRLVPGMALAGRVVDSRGRPVAGVRVHAHPDEERPGPAARGPLTKEDGTFRMTWAHAPPEGSRGLVLAESPKHLLGFSRPVEFRRGGRREGVEVRLLDPSSLGVRLVDESGTGWPHASIVLTRAPGGVPEGIAVRDGGRVSLFTDTEGRLDLRHLRAGEYRLAVEIPQRIPFETTFRIEPESRLDLGNLLVGRGFEVSGRVTDSARAPVPGVIVQLTPEGGGVPFTVPVDDQGAIRLFGLPAGRYVLSVSSRVHEDVRQVLEAGTTGLEIRLQPLAALAVRLDGLPEEHFGGVVDLSRLDGPIEDRGPVTNTLEPAARETRFENLPRGLYRLRARVGPMRGTAETRLGGTFEATAGIAMERGGVVRGRVLDASGRGVDGAPVQVDAGDPGGQWSVRAGAGGVFEVEALPPGEVTLRSRPEGHPEGAVAVAVDAGAQVAQDVILPAAAAVEIRATGPAGTPVADLDVWLRNEDGEVEPAWVEGGGPASTSSLGLLKLVGIRPGVYTLHVSLGPEVIERRRIRLEPGGMLPVTLEVSR